MTNSITGYNSDFTFDPAGIEGVWIITPFVRHDERGCFIKDYNEKIFRDNGIGYSVCETFYSFSKQNTIRGLHFQREKQMPKLVRCLAGSIYDVAIDLREGSPTFKKAVGVELSEDNNKSLLIPEGCAHGFLALRDALVSYKCSEIFIPEYDDGIIWNDKDLAVCWPLKNDTKVIISEKDANLQPFSVFQKKYGSL